MLKNVLIVAATEAEADALRSITGIRHSDELFYFGNYEITLLVTGVGSAATSWSMMKWLCSNPAPGLAVNIGIAGSYNDDIKVGDVVTPVTDCFADSGIETEDGFRTLAETGLSDAFTGSGRLVPDNRYTMNLSGIVRPVNAITVNTVTGISDTLKKRMLKFKPDIETMEGATFFYICLREKIPFVALRSISNKVEPRNRKNWDIPLAVRSLSERLKDFLVMAD